ncbi:MAG: thioesterase family protein [Hyphomicrobiaceae bacterium]
MTAKPFRYFLRVRYGECDQQGVVYNARYGEYVDLAATEFLRHALKPKDMFDGSFEFQVVRLLIEWKGPARFDDVVEIAVTTAKLGTTSFTLEYVLKRAATGELIATAETVNVYIDPKDWTKAAVPEEMRVALERAARGLVVDHAGAGVAV